MNLTEQGLERLVVAICKICGLGRADWDLASLRSVLEQPETFNKVKMLLTAYDKTVSIADEANAEIHPDFRKLCNIKIKE